MTAKKPSFFFPVLSRTIGIIVKFENIDQSEGQYDESTKTITLNNKKNEREQYRAARHEIQHAIQHRTRTFGGSSLAFGKSIVDDRILTLRKRIRSGERVQETGNAGQRKGSDVAFELEKDKSELKRITENQEDYIYAYYEYSAGELEGFNVINRFRAIYFKHTSNANLT